MKLHTTRIPYTQYISVCVEDYQGNLVEIGRYFERETLESVVGDVNLRLTRKSVNVHLEYLAA